MVSQISKQLWKPYVKVGLMEPLSTPQKGNNGAHSDSHALLWVLGGGTAWSSHITGTESLGF